MFYWYFRYYPVPKVHLGSTMGWISPIPADTQEELVIKIQLLEIYEFEAAPGVMNHCIVDPPTWKKETLGGCALDEIRFCSPVALTCFLFSCFRLWKRSEFDLKRRIWGCNIQGWGRALCRAFCGKALLKMGVRLIALRAFGVALWIPCHAALAVWRKAEAGLFGGCRPLLLAPLEVLVLAKCKIGHVPPPGA